MERMDQRDIEILGHYARTGNRELYWNYLANHQGSDGYGLLALGVVRNDSMPGAVANHFAQSHARRPLSERDWERFGENLIARDLERRMDYLERGRGDLALNLPVQDVQAAHDGAFRGAGIDPNAWTPRLLLEAARRQGGEPAAEQVWANMLDSRGLGLGRLGITSWDVMYTYNDAGLPATRYLGALTGASALAMADRGRTDPDVIGARDFYYMYDRGNGQWASVSNGQAGPHIRPVTDPGKITELNDARAVRLESQAQRDDWHPQDPNRHQPIARSPFTLADAGAAQERGTRLAEARDASPQPTGDTALSPHPLFQQAMAAMTRRDAELGREPDNATCKIALACAGLAARGGYARIDDIVFNVATGRLAAGERFFVLQGGRDDPAHLRESMPTRDALAMTPERMQQQVAELDAVRVHAPAVQRSDDPQRVQPTGPQMA